MEYEDEGITIDTTGAQENQLPNGLPQAGKIPDTASAVTVEVSGQVADSMNAKPTVDEKFLDRFQHLLESSDAMTSMLAPFISELNDIKIALSKSYTRSEFESNQVQQELFSQIEAFAQFPLPLGIADMSSDAKRELFSLSTDILDLISNKLIGDVVSPNEEPRRSQFIESMQPLADILIQGAQKQEALWTEIFEGHPFAITATKSHLTICAKYDAMLKKIGQEPVTRAVKLDDPHFRYFAFGDEAPVSIKPPSHESQIAA